MWDSSITRWGLDNWQVSGITSFISGAPCAFELNGSTACGASQPGTTFTMVDGTDITGGGDAPRVFITCNPNADGQRSVDQWFHTGCVHRPAQGTFGNAPASPFIGPGVNNWNIALFKNVPIKEKVTFQLRVETYNTFNHTQFTAINTTPRFDITGNQVNSSFGKVGAAADPRYMQLAVRFSF